MKENFSCSVFSYTERFCLGTPLLLLLVLMTAGWLAGRVCIK